MRTRSGLIVCVLVAGAVTLAAIEPRLHFTFPSPIDDWTAIRDAPDQLREVVRFGSPETQRYRPGFTAWNALQWHTLGAPESFDGPLFWSLVRLAILVVGVTLLAALIVLPSQSTSLWRDRRRLLVVGVPIASLTAPSLMIDVARYGPQEPLLVGCTALGAVLLTRVAAALLEPRRLGAPTVAALVGGLVLWAFGVLQKETSICLLLLLPFLVPTLRAQRGRWDKLAGGRQALIAACSAAVLLPFAPMLVRTTQLALADDRLYGDVAAASSFERRLSDQLERASEVLHSHLPSAIVIAVIVLLAVRLVRTGADWLSLGFLAVAFAFVLFAAEAGVVASRYYLPAIVLAALALARTAGALGPTVVMAVGLVLVGWGSFQAADARGWVQWWVDGERAREMLVREAAAREAGGCDVGFTGLNVELVQALPVLMPLAREAPRDCAPGDRFVVVIDPGGPGDATGPDDPVLGPCEPELEPVWSSHIAKIVRCTS